MAENDFRLFLRAGFDVHGRTVNCVAARGIATIGPVHGSVVQIEVKIDRFGKSLKKEFNVPTCGRSLALRNIHASAEDSPLASVVRAFLGPVDVTALRVEGDSDAPLSR